MRRFVVLLVAFAAAAAQAAADRGAELAAVVRAERDFAARAQVVNARQAFVENFAPDAVLFRPYPERAFPKLGEGVDWPVNIQWRPSAAAISGAGDLGYTTGPAEYRKTPADAPHAFSHYSSVWERQADGRYLVVFDTGIGHPGPVDAIPDWTAPTVAPSVAPAVGAPERERAWQGLLAFDAALGEAAATDTAGALARVLAEDGRYHAPGALPALGRGAAAARLRASGMTQRWKPAGGKLAASADFGYVYGTGTYAQSGATPATGELAYLHVWQKRDGDWQLLLRVTSPIKPPPPQP